MTQAKAASVASAIITAGYQATVYIRSDGQWAVRVKDTTVPSATVNDFATQQSITASVRDVEFV